MPCLHHTTWYSYLLVLTWRAPGTPGQRETAVIAASCRIEQPWSPRCRNGQSSSQSGFVGHSSSSQASPSLSRQGSSLSPNPAYAPPAASATDRTPVPACQVVPLPTSSYPRADSGRLQRYPARGRRAKVVRVATAVRTGCSTYQIDFFSGLVPVCWLSSSPPLLDSRASQDGRRATAYWGNRGGGPM